MEEPKKIKVEFNYDGSKSVFTDIVEVSIVDDTVNLSFGIKDKGGKTAQVSHKVYMTLGHYFRFVDACNNTANHIKDQIEEINKIQKEK